jgi:hypothetical protein
MVVILVQMVVIFSLSLWIVEDYLNNPYLREYISGVFQSDGLIMGGVATLLVLGSVTGVVFARRMRGQKSMGAVSLGITAPHPSIKVASGASPKPAEAATRPESDFHPVVAALKADMADRRLSFGSIRGAGSEQPPTTSHPTVPFPGLEVQKTSVLDQLTPNRQPPMAGPRPVQMGPPFPQQPFHDPRSQPTGLRVEEVRPLAQRPMPFLRPQEPAGSTVLQPSQTPPPQFPTNVTTVITGIMPAQKKKDPTAPPEENPSSSR